MLAFALDMDFSFTRRGRGVPRRAARLARRQPRQVPRELGRGRRPGRRSGLRLRPDPGAAQGLAAPAERGALGGHQLAEGVERPRGHAGAERDLRRGDGAGARPGHLQHERHLADRPDDHQVGHAGAAAALAAVHPQRRRALVPGLQRARGRLRPRQHAHDGDPRRRPLRRERPEDLDLLRAPREVGSVPPAHRPDRVRARREARGHHRVHHRHGDARHRVPPDPRHHRRHDAERGVVHRRGDPDGLPARRRGRGLAGRDEHARPRARRHGGPVDHDGVGPEVDDLGRARGEPGRARRPGAPRAHRPRVHGHRADPAAQLPGAHEDHQGPAELARGAAREAAVVEDQPDPRRARGRPARHRRGPRPRAAPTRSTAARGPATTPGSATRRSAPARPRSRRTSSPRRRSSSPASRWPRRGSSSGTWRR